MKNEDKELSSLINPETTSEENKQKDLTESQ